MSAEWIGETTLAPSQLGPVPEFGRNGQSPPLRTEPVIVSWALIADAPPLTGTSRPPLTEAPLTERELLVGLISECRALYRELYLPIVPQGENWDRLSLINYHNTKRVVYRQYWQRDDPVIQLVPGETQIYSVQLNSGLTDQVLREFSASLGLGGKVSGVELSAQLSGSLSRTVTISTERQTTRTKQLTNTRDGYMRRVAVWHVVHVISLHGVQANRQVERYNPRFDSLKFEWKQVQRIEFADIAAPQSSYFDVRTPLPVYCSSALNTPHRQSSRRAMFVDKNRVQLLPETVSPATRRHAD